MINWDKKSWDGKGFQVAHPAVKMIYDYGAASAGANSNVSYTISIHLNSGDKKEFTLLNPKGNDILELRKEAEKYISEL